MHLKITKTLAVAVFCLTLLATQSFGEKDETRMIDKVKLFNTMGFKKGFSPIEKIVSNATMNDENGITTIEGDADLIDTPEEFVTALYYSPIEIKDISIRKALQKELPQGKEGALRLCAMWLEKAVATRFGNQTNEEKKKLIDNYDLIIKTLIKKQKLSQTEVDKYYKTAVVKQIDELVDEEFGKNEGTFKNIDTSLYYANGSTELHYKVSRMIENGKLVYVVIREAETPIKVQNFNELKKHGFTESEIGYCKDGLLLPIETLLPKQIALIKKTLTDFLTNPNEANYKLVVAIRVLYSENLWASPIIKPCIYSYGNVIDKISLRLRAQLGNDFEKALAGDLALNYSEAFKDTIIIPAIK